MSREQPRKLYTVEEARALVSELRPLVAAMQVEQRRLQDEVKKLAELSTVIHQNGHAPQAWDHEQLILELSESIRSKLREFDDLTEIISRRIPHTDPIFLAHRVMNLSEEKAIPLRKSQTPPSGNSEERRLSAFRSLRWTTIEDFKRFSRGTLRTAVPINARHRMLRIKKGVVIFPEEVVIETSSAHDRPCKPSDSKKTGS
jgi:hypothetical protein